MIFTSSSDRWRWAAGNWFRRFLCLVEYLFGCAGLIRGFVASFDVDESRESFSGSSLALEASVERFNLCICASLEGESSFSTLRRVEESCKSVIDRIRILAMLYFRSIIAFSPSSEILFTT